MSNRPLLSVESGRRPSHEAFRRPSPRIWWDDEGRQFQPAVTQSVFGDKQPAARNLTLGDKAYTRSVVENNAD